MDIELIPFEKIDKNKWNGTVHYAKNGNIFGYHWYLKSVVKEWDALIEGDYQSVMPIFRDPLTEVQWSFLHELGPYSVLKMNDSRCEAFYDLWQKIDSKKQYIFNHSCNAFLSQNRAFDIKLQARFIKNIFNPYLQQSELYSEKIKDAIYESNGSIYEYENIQKPELLLADDPMDDITKNTYFRILYNAQLRGNALLYKVNNLKNGKFATAIFLKDQYALRLIYRNKNNDPASEMVIIDTILKSFEGQAFQMILDKDLHHFYQEFGLEQYINYNL